MIYNLESNAKINVGLNVVGKKENGYHLLDMVMLPIDLADRLTIDIDQKYSGLIIETNDLGIPTDKKNIVYKVYKAFYSNLDKAEVGMKMYLEKKIPHQAGLGGGSSNGGIFLKFLNEFHGEPFSKDELVEIGKKIGADLPFFIYNESSRVKGIGEIIEPIKNNFDPLVILIKPTFGISTIEAYSGLKKIENLDSANIDKIIEGLSEKNIKKIDENLRNNLEQGLLEWNNEIKSFRKRLEELSEVKFHMSGSGSTYFTFLLKDNLGILSKIREKFKDCEIYCCNFK